MTREEFILKLKYIEEFTKGWTEDIYQRVVGLKDHDQQQRNRIAELEETIRRYHPSDEELYAQWEQQRDELTSWRTTAQSVGAVDPHALSLHLGEQRKEIARLRAALDWSELRIDNTKLRWALDELGPTHTNAEAYVKIAVEQNPSYSELRLVALPTREEPQSEGIRQCP